MPTGTVKWFNDQKGFGFIKQDDLNEDIFVHHTAIKMEGFRTLAPGEPVEYELKQDDKGFKAINVTHGEEAPAVEGTEAAVATEEAPAIASAPETEAALQIEEAPKAEAIAEEAVESAPETETAPQIEEAPKAEAIESTPEQA